jgi:predicted amidohydrolase YtcJ
MSEPDCPTLLYNAKIYTFDDNATIADSILVAKGRVLAVGSHAELESLAGLPVQKRDLRGSTVLPGLVDTHPHLLHFAARQAPLVDIADARNHAQIVDRIAARAKTTPEGAWIQTTPVGEPYYFIRRSYRDLEEHELPTRHVLDRASNRHPIAIMAWEPNIPNAVAFNSLALDRLGITESTPDRVAGVFIEKDSDGQPTGRLTGVVNMVFSADEFAYQLWRKVPLPNFELVAPATRKAIAAHHRLGVTAVYENHFMQRRQIDVYRNLRDSRELKLRVATAQETDSFGSAWAQPRRGF